MGSNPIYKSIDEYTQQTFKAYKTWVMTESTIGQYSSSVNEAVYVSASVLIDEFGNNPSGMNKKSLFYSIYNLYYRFDKLQYDALGEYLDFQDRDLSYRAIVTSIGNDYIGERIKPGSISIVDGPVLIKDDGYGNLYDSSDTTVYVPSSSLMGHWSFNEGFITSGNVATTFINRNHVQGNPPALSYNTRFVNGIYGTRLQFSGESSSYAVVDDYRGINFRTNEDFAVSLWVWIPISQSMKSTTDNSILEKWSNWGGYPFVIRAINDTWPNSDAWGKIYCATWDTSTTASITSTNKLNDGLPHHIVYQRRGSTYELYVDGTLNGSSTINMGQTHNDSPLYIGARGNDNLYTTNQPLYNFSGSVDELRIYSGSLTSTQIATLHASASNTNVVGNAFYSHGILVLTNLSGSYTDLMLLGSGFVLTYKSTITITENSILATVLPSEYNMTFNPSATDVYSADEMNYRPFVTGSEWSPYITTMGLYDDDLNLVAIAKFARPIKKPIDMPITFAIRWDS